VIDYGSSVGQVRLLIPDTDETALLLTDEQIKTLVGLEGGNVKLATAQALDLIASSEALVSKVIRTQDVQTDGAKVAAELRARASELRRQVAEGEGDDTVGFGVVDFIDPWKRYWPGRELTEPQVWGC
jgi:hypothetical protein